MVAAETITVSVRVLHGDFVDGRASNGSFQIELRKDGFDSIHDVKSKICQAAGGNLQPDLLWLTFGPNKRMLGRQFVGDAAVDETTTRIAQFNIIGWLERFPHWSLSVRLLPATPPPPGEAAYRVAAETEGQDPDKKVREARSKGEIPRVNDLPKPWGPKEHKETFLPDKPKGGHYIVSYPDGYSPLIDV